jgi:hypothetical protein
MVGGWVATSGQSGMAGWQRGLKQTAAVVCHFLTAAELPPGCRAIPFSLLSEASIAELRRYEDFIRQPI